MADEVEGSAKMVPARGPDREPVAVPEAPAPRASKVLVHPDAEKLTAAVKNVDCSWAKGTEQLPQQSKPAPFSFENSAPLFPQASDKSNDGQCR